MVEDLENEKWMDVSIRLYNSSKGIVLTKTGLAPYAKEIGWTLKVDKREYLDEEGGNMFGIYIAPKGNKCSPEEIIEKRDLIEGSVIGILKYMIYNSRPKQFPKKILSQAGFYKSKDKKDMLDFRCFEVIHIHAELKKAIRFELEKPELFKKVFFGLSLIEWYKENLDKQNKFFITEENLNVNSNIVKRLEENGMPKITIEKKRFLGKMFT